MNAPIVQIASTGGIFTRSMHFKKAGDIELGHKHDFDHLTLLASGKLKVTVEDRTAEFIAPQMIFINKDKRHELVALEDDTVAYCIHSVNHSAGDILDPNMVP